MFSGFKKKGGPSSSSFSNARQAPSAGGDRYSSLQQTSTNNINNYNDNDDNDELSSTTKLLQGTAITNNQPENYPEEIEEDLKAVRRLVSKASGTRCHACGQQQLLPLGDLTSSASSWFESLDRSQRSGRDFSLCALRCSNNSQCGGRETCAGCGKEPVQRESLLTENASGGGGGGSGGGNSKLVFCCRKGVAYAVWALLCKFDEIELSMQPKETSSSSSSQGNRNNSAASQSGGTGYGSTRRSDGFAIFQRSLQPQYQQQRHLSFAKADDRHDGTKRTIFLLIRDLIASQAGRELATGLAESIELSFLPDRAAQILRNDSMAEMAKRGDILLAVISLLETLVTSDDTRYLVTDARFAKTRSPGLAALSQDAAATPSSSGGGGRSLEVERCKDSMSSSLLLSMANLNTQCETLLSASRTFNGNFDDRSGRELIGIARRVVEVYATMKANEGQQQQNQSQSKKGKEAFISPEAQWKAFNAGNKVKFVDGVLAALDPRWAAAAEGIRYSDPGRIKRITLELADMTTSLPDGVFLCAQWERPDAMKCMIVGPEGTPYEGGLFEFDIVCPGNYPRVPPKVLFAGARGTHHFNPNLHPDGKVCLSLLGTWPGPPETQWQANVSTLLQVLISIQSMILGVAQPILNEPGFEHADRQRGFERHARGFNDAVRSLTARVAILEWLLLERCWGGFWHRLLVVYFRVRAGALVAKVSEWCAGQPQLRVLRSRPLLQAFAALGGGGSGNVSGSSSGGGGGGMGGAMGGWGGGRGRGGYYGQETPASGAGKDFVSVLEETIRLRLDKESA